MKVAAKQTSLSAEKVADSQKHARHHRAIVSLPVTMSKSHHLGPHLDSCLSSASFDDAREEKHF